MSNTTEASARAAVVTSVTATRPSCQVTPAINARDVTLTPSSRAPAHGDRRRRGMNGWLAATNTNAGREMAAGATAAPGPPPTRDPMKGGGGENRTGGKPAAP